MNRREFFKSFFLPTVGVGVGWKVVPLLLPKEESKPEVPQKVWYPWAENGEMLPMHPDNETRVIEADILIASFKTKEEYAAIFDKAGDYYDNWNDWMAGYIGRKASRKLPRGWMPPKSVLRLAPMLTEYGVRFSEGPSDKYVRPSNPQKWAARCSSK